MPDPGAFAYTAPNQQNAYGTPVENLPEDVPGMASQSGFLGTLQKIRPYQETDRNMRSIMPGSLDRNRVVPEAIFSGPRSERGA